MLSNNIIKQVHSFLKIFTIKLIILISVFTIVPTVAVGQWAQTNGPEGGWITALTINPTTPDTLFAGSFNGGVFKSIDGGSNWNAVTPYLANRSIHALAIDPVVSSTVYAGNNAGVHKSTDSGVTWNTINTGMEKTIVYSLAIDQLTDGSILAGTFGRSVFKYTVDENPPEDNSVDSKGGGAIDLLILFLLFGGVLVRQLSSRKTI